MRRSTLTRKMTSPIALTTVAMTVSFCVVLGGCAQSDNPQIVTAAPPPAPKPEELKVPTTGGDKKVEYGSGARYKKAMGGIDKVP